MFKVTQEGARKVFQEMLRMADAGEPKEDVESIIARMGLQISQPEEVWEAIGQAINDNPHVVQEVKSGKEQAVGPLVGQVLRKVQHDPVLIREYILKRIGEQ